MIISHPDADVLLLLATASWWQYQKEEIKTPQTGKV